MEGSNSMLLTCSLDLGSEFNANFVDDCVAFVVVCSSSCFDTSRREQRHNVRQLGVLALPELNSVFEITFLDRADLVPRKIHILLGLVSEVSFDRQGPSHEGTSASSRHP